MLQAAPALVQQTPHGMALVAGQMGRVRGWTSTQVGLVVAASFRI